MLPMERERIYLYFFLTLMVVFLLLALFTLTPFIVPILWAVVLSIVIYPVHMYVQRLVRSRTLSAFIVTSVVFLFLIVPLSIISVLVVQQLVDVTQKVLLFLKQHSYKDILEQVSKIPLVRDYVSGLEPVVEFLQREEVRKVIAESLQRILRFLGDKLGQVAFVMGKNVFYTFVFLLAFFFLLRDGLDILRRVERLIPMDKEDLERVMGTVYRTTLAVVYGSVGTAMIQAFLGYVGYSIVGINFALLWSVVTFFAAFIPPFGASAVWFPLAVYTFFNISPWKALFLGLWGMLLISTMDNLVRPLIIKQGINIPYVVLFFATIGGLLKFGFIGLFLGPIIFTTLFTLFKIYERRILNRDT